MLTRTDANNHTWTYTYDPKNRLLSTTDPLGHVTTQTWDGAGNLTSVTDANGNQTQFAYDVLGRMLTRMDSTGTTYFQWDGMNMVQETAPSGNVTRYNIPNGMLMSFDLTISGVTTTYQVMADALGSVRKATDSTGTVVATFDTDAWGNALASTSDSIPNGGLQYRFLGASGVRWDSATGLYYARQRWYDPSLGRFLSRDLVRGTNRYEYAFNNPTTLVDINGMIPQLPPAWKQQIEDDVLNNASFGSTVSQRRKWLKVIRCIMWVEGFAAKYGIRDDYNAVQIGDVNMTGDILFSPQILRDTYTQRTTSDTHVYVGFFQIRVAKHQAQIQAAMATYGITGSTKTGVFDPRVQIDVGLEILADEIDAWRGNVDPTSAADLKKKIGGVYDSCNQTAFADCLKSFAWK